MLEIFVLLLYNVGDAVRDAMMFNAISVSGLWRLELPSFLRFPRWTKKQWHWHIVKWLSVYPLQLLFLFNAGFGFREIVVLAFAMLVAWQITYRMVLK